MKDSTLARLALLVSVAVTQVAVAQQGELSRSFYNIGARSSDLVAVAVADNSGNLYAHVNAEGAPYIAKFDAQGSLAWLERSGRTFGSNLDNALALGPLCLYSVSGYGPELALNQSTYSGTLVRSELLGDLGLGGRPKLAATPDGGAAVATESTADPYHLWLVAKVDSIGVRSWVTSLPLLPGYSGEVIGIANLSAGRLLVVGEHFGGASDGGRAFVVGPDGQLLDSYSLKTVPTRIVAASDGSVYVVGMSNRFKYDFAAAHIGSTGVRDWERTWPDFLGGLHTPLTATAGPAGSMVVLRRSSMQGATVPIVVQTISPTGSLIRYLSYVVSFDNTNGDGSYDKVFAGADGSLTCMVYQGLGDHPVDLRHFAPNGQQVWQRRLGPAGEDTYVGGTVMTPDGGCTAVVRARSPEYDYDLAVTRLDPSGNVTRQYAFNASMTASENCVGTARGDDGSIWIASNFWRNTAGWPAVSRFDREGHHVWTYQDRPVTQMWTQTSRFAISGQDSFMGGRFEEFDGNANTYGTFVTAVDANGTLKWRSKFPNPQGLCLGVSPVESGDVDLLRIEGTDGRVLLSHLDGNGAVAWERDLGTDPRHWGWLTAHPDGLLVLERKQGPPTYAFTLRLFDGQGAEVWSTPVPGITQVNATNGLVVSPDGHIVVNGYSSNFPRLVELDGQGRIEWATTLPHPVQSVSFLSSSWAPGNEVVTTFPTRLTNGEDDIVVARLRADGSVRWETSWDSPIHRRDYGIDVTVDASGVAVVTGHYGFGDFDDGAVTLLYNPDGSKVFPDSGGIFHDGGALFDVGVNTTGSFCRAWRDPDGTVTLAGSGSNGLNWQDLAVVRYKS